MIESLVLKRFGKFRDRSFGFKRTTVFYGGNESGKTTIFDALFKALCSPPGTRSEAKKLKDRYGDDDDVELISTMADASFDVDEFMALNAIRASDLVFEAKDGADWVKTVKSQVFLGGLDPERLVRGLEPMADERANRPINKELKRLETRLKDLQTELTKRHSQRDQALSKERALEESATKLQKLASQRTDLDTGLKDHRKNLERHETSQKYATCLERLRLLQGRETKIHRQNELTSVSKVVLEEMESAAAAVARLAPEIDFREDQYQDLTGRLKTLEQRVNEQRRLAASFLSIDQLAKNLLNDLQQLHDKPPMTTRWFCNFYILSVGMFFGLIATVAYFFLVPIAYAIPTAIATGIISGGLLLGSLARRIVRDEASTTASRLTLERRWNESQADGVILSADDLSLEERLAHTIETHNMHIKLLAELNTRSQETSTELDEKLIELHSCRAAHLSAEAQRDRLLQIHETTSIPEYRMRVVERDQLERELQDTPTFLPIDRPLKTVCFELEQDLRRLSEMDRISGLVSDQDLTHIRRQIRASEEQLQSLDLGAISLRSQLERQRGEIRGELKGLPEEILRLEREIQQLTCEADALRLDKSAAKLARDLFRELADDSSAQLDELATELAAMLGSDAPEADVRLDGLSPAGFTIKDAAGTLRPLKNLSSGTQDLCLLSTRLLLARKQGRQESLLVLDDPFVMMDERRENRALELVRNFQDETGWQVVFFTKDERLKSRIVQTFDPSLIHQL